MDGLCLVAGARATIDIEQVLKQGSSLLALEVKLLHFNALGPLEDLFFPHS